MSTCIQAAGLFFACIVLFGTRAGAQALAGPPDRAIQAHLNAGEFGPARAVADRIAERAARDAALARIAAAQIAAGGGQAAFDTAASIRDDVLRSNALQGFVAPRTGAGAGRGGSSMADFDTLIELITSTIAPTTWVDAGGAGAIDAFPGGVFVDTEGLMRTIPVRLADEHLADVRAGAVYRGGSGDVRAESTLRYVSLPRLEKQVQLLWAAGLPPNEAMRTLAGLRKIKYLFVYPDEGDIVLAGPAGDWRADAEDRLVSVSTGRPVLQLDDLVVLLRNAYGEGGRFGCSITPTKERLAATKAFLAESSKRPLTPTSRPRWLKQIRDHLGKQEIAVYGIDPGSRAARVIVEADYRMKLVGMGLEDGGMNVPSYLSRIRVGPGEAPPPMDVLRWWFTLNYKAIHATPDRSGFEVRGQGVQVLSENEMITARGERVHTGKSDILNREFAHDFTKHFESLAKTYPIYADLQNVFDLALVAAICRAEDLPGRAGWHRTHFGPADKYRVRISRAPKEVETVINHRVINRVHVVAGVSGGVTVRTRPLVEGGAIKFDEFSLIDAMHNEGAPPQNLPQDAWWWD
jgi:hypothetical protein